MITLQHRAAIGVTVRPFISVTSVITQSRASEEQGGVVRPDLKSRGILSTHMRANLGPKAADICALFYVY